MERDIGREILPIGIGLGLLAVSLCSFSAELKHQVREEQDNKCAHCGNKVKHLEIHHRLPQAMGGADNRQNAVGLDKRHHKYYDELATKQHIIFPNIPLNQVPDSLYKKGLKHKIK